MKSRLKYSTKQEEGQIEIFLHCLKLYRILIICFKKY